MTLEKEIAAAVAACRSLTERARQLASLRRRDGRSIGGTRRSELADAAAAMRVAADELSALADADGSDVRAELAAIAERIR